MNDVLFVYLQKRYPRSAKKGYRKNDFVWFVNPVGFHAKRLVFTNMGRFIIFIKAMEVLLYLYKWVFDILA